MTLTKFRAYGLAILLLACLRGVGAASEGPLQWADTNGALCNPLKQSGGRIAVLFFMTTDCPIADAYAPEVNRIVSDYGRKGVAFYIVDVDYGLSPAEAIKHAREYGYNCRTILDPLHTLAAAAGASVSSQAVVVGRRGAIVYRGRIDDRAVGFGKIRPKPTREDLRLTLDSVLAGKVPPFASTPCVGCIISPPALLGKAPPRVSISDLALPVPTVVRSL